MALTTLISALLFVSLISSSSSFSFYYYLPKSFSSNNSLNFVTTKRMTHDGASRLTSLNQSPPNNHNSASANPNSPSPPSCVAKEARSHNLFSTTPLIHSIPLSRLCSSSSHSSNPSRVRRSRRNVYLKLDLLQPSGSFKDRGMAHLCMTVRKVYGANNRRKIDEVNGSDNPNHPNPFDSPKMRLISSSGGNAGLALTTVAQSLPDVSVSVVVPKTTKSLVVERLKGLGAEVTVFGENWNEADGLARRWVEEANDANASTASSGSSRGGGGGGAVYVSPYDNPLLWTGHSTVVDEIITQLLELEWSSFSSLSSSPSSEATTATNIGANIGAILASVGGGGLLCGIFEGIERNHYGGDDLRSSVVRGTKVVACETEGAASFAASFHASNAANSADAAATVGTDGDSSRGKNILPMVRLEAINSVATSLGALEVTPAVIHRAHRHQERGRQRRRDEESGGSEGSGEDVLSFTCTDAEAIDACVKFASDHRMLVEPACGAALAVLYSERLREKLLDELEREERKDGVGVAGEMDGNAIIMEVCGGSGVNLELLEGWKKQFLVD